MSVRRRLLLVAIATLLIGYFGVTGLRADPGEGNGHHTSRVSSGLFGIPAGAASVDWMVVNDATTPQTFTATVFRAGVGPKTVVAPGPLTFTVAPGASTHNANSVGPAQPFVPGFYYEVVIERTSANLLPSVHVWQDNVNTIIPGTLIPPGSWVRLDN